MGALPLAALVVAVLGGDAPVPASDAVLEPEALTAPGTGAPGESDGDSDESADPRAEEEDTGREVFEGDEALGGEAVDAPTPRRPVQRATPRKTRRTAPEQEPVEGNAPSPRAGLAAAAGSGTACALGDVGAAVLGVVAAVVASGVAAVVFSPLFTALLLGTCSGSCSGCPLVCAVCGTSTSVPFTAVTNLAAGLPSGVVGVLGWLAATLPGGRRVPMLPVVALFAGPAAAGCTGAALVQGMFSAVALGSFAMATYYWRPSVEDPDAARRDVAAERLGFFTTWGCGLLGAGVLAAAAVGLVGQFAGVVASGVGSARLGRDRLEDESTFHLDLLTVPPPQDAAAPARTWPRAADDADIPPRRPRRRSRRRAPTAPPAAPAPPASPFVDEPVTRAPGAATPPPAPAPTPGEPPPVAY